MIEDSGINTSGCHKRGLAMDKKARELFKKREEKRRPIKEAEEFAKLVTSLTL